MSECQVLLAFGACHIDGIGLTCSIYVYLFPAHIGPVIPYSVISCYCSTCWVYSTPHRTMLSRTVSRLNPLRTRAISQRFASTKVRYAILSHSLSSLTHNTDLERDTPRGHSCQAGTTQTIGVTSHIWTFRGLIKSLESGALANSH